MTNLPITSNIPQSPASAMNAVQANSTTGGQITRGSLCGAVAAVKPPAGGKAPTFGAPLADTTEPFADILARQIGEVAPSFTNVAPGAITIDGAAPPLKGEQDQTVVAASTPDDQAGTLAAMLLQLPQEMRTPVANDAASTPDDQAGTLAAVLLHPPQEMRTPVANDAASTSTATKKMAGIDASTRKPASPVDTKLDMANIKPGKADAAAITADRQPLADVIGRNAAKRMEPATSLTQPGPNATHLVASSAASAMMPGMLTNNRLTDTTQSIATPLGSSGWADDFAQKLSWMSMQKNQVAELHLNPPDLGPLNVVLKVSDNQATALFTSPHSAVREAVENAMPKLRETLADNGIMLGNTTVSDQFPRDRSAEGFMQQGSGAVQRVDFSSASESTGVSPAAVQAIPARRHNGMVDTFA